MPQTTRATCNALIRRSIDLCCLYRQAALRCEPSLALVLRENVQTLALLIADLQRQVSAEGGSVRQRGSWRGTPCWHVSDALLLASSDRDAGWVHLLAHHESALLIQFERHVDADPNPLARLLRRQLPRLRSIDLDIHALHVGARY